MDGRWALIAAVLFFAVMGIAQLCVGAYAMGIVDLAIMAFVAFNAWRILKGKR